MSDKENTAPPIFADPPHAPTGVAPTGTEATPPPEKPPEPVFDGAALQRAFDATTTQGAGALAQGGELIPRRRITFTVDVGELAPGIFHEDIQITLAALTSAMEIKTLKGVTDPTVIGTLTIKAALERVNGAPIPSDQMDFLWEALAPGGRQIVMTMYQEIGNITPVGMGKAQASSTRG